MPFISLSLPIGNKPTVLSCDLPEKTVSDSLNTIRFSLKNFAGRDIDDVVNYYIDNPQNSFSAQTNTIVPINWHSLGLLTSGKHRLVAVCGNDTLRQDFITFSMADKKPCINTDDWFYVSSTQFPSDGSPVYLQVGSSAPDTHILYTAISGDSITANSLVTDHHAGGEERLRKAQSVLQTGYDWYSEQMHTFR